jgi:hypothetical protein
VTVTTCKTTAEVRAAALADAQHDPPLTQDQADLIAAIRAANDVPATGGAAPKEA